MVCRFSSLRSFFSRAIPHITAAVGLSLTLWFAYQVQIDDQERLRRHFMNVARQQENSISRLLAEELSSLKVVQRVMNNVAHLDETTLVSLLEPLSHDMGMNGFAWAPQAQWADGNPVFAVELAIPHDAGRKLVGLDLSSMPALRPLIEKAINTGAPVSSGYGLSLFGPSLGRKMATLVIPVYWTEWFSSPPPGDRTVRGLFVASLDIATLFGATQAAGQSGLRASLFDSARPGEAGRPPPDDPGGVPGYSRNFEVAGHLWTWSVEADAAWLKANESGRTKVIMAGGLLLTLLSFLVLSWLPRRSALVDKLERSQSVVLKKRREAENRFFSTISVMAEGLMVFSANGECLFANPAAGHILSFLEQASQRLDLKHLPAQFLNSGGDEIPNPLMNDRLLSVLCTRRELHYSVLGLRFQNGKTRWFEINTSPLVTDDDGRPRMVATFSDITERKKVQKRIEFLAYHDSLTGLPNRMLLRDRMMQAVARSERTHARVALMFLDLDRFKQINDSLGHPVGDALLKAIAERLEGCMRESDTISRQGGDEFVIMLNDVRDMEAVARIAKKILEIMERPFQIDNHALITSFSIGIALFPDDGRDFDVLLRKADAAMYDAKGAGRNNLRFFTEQMNRRAVERMSLEMQLRQALEKGEFVLHYQPQLDLKRRAIVGTEALVRWNSPENGLVPPGKFIPVAEDSGIIVRLGEWVLREACRQAKAWQNAKLPLLTVAVNLSTIQFRQPNLVDTVIDALTFSGLDAHHLELELTESILLQDTKAMLDVVRRLKMLGLKLSIDDFGTGYSSLAYLKHFAIDKLKIDQSFVRDLLTDPDDAAIVQAIIQMARSLKLRTIAEGVESEALSNFLSRSHCDEIQGYWLARPMPADEFEAFVRAYPGKGSQTPPALP
jgi:diguanylate cyclase (GGDEF)-like protein